MDNKSIVLIVTSNLLLSDIELVAENDMIIMISETQLGRSIKTKIDCRELSKKLFIKYSISNLILLSKDDSFDQKQIFETIKSILLNNNSGVPLSLLLPYSSPPVIESRNDGSVQSCLISKSLFDLRVFYRHADSFIHLIYYLTYQYLNRNQSENLKVYQVGKPPAQNRPQNTGLGEGLKKALLIIPHKGSLKLLNRSLLHLDKTRHVPKNINLCFDEKSSHSKFNISDYKYLEDKLTVYLNNPTNVGPYLPRHYSVVNADSKYVFFQDSDDISLTERFEKQIAEINLRKLDMIGSHKIRINQFSKKIQIIRYPLEVNDSLHAHYFHPVFHPTCLITKSAYLRVGGFSTDRKFANDTQFLLRAYFSLKIGNVDDFLYLRFNRPNSLTTSKKTRVGGAARAFLHWIWRNELKLILNGKLKLKDSSLGVKSHRFPFKMIKTEKGGIFSP